MTVLYENLIALLPTTKTRNSSKLARKTEKPPKSSVFTVDLICLLNFCQLSLALV